MPDFDPFADDVSEFSWTPSEIAAEERRWLPSVDGSAEVDPKGPDACRRAQWCCLRFRADDWTVDADGSYYCISCGGTEFLNSGEPAKLETATGTWMFPTEPVLCQLMVNPHMVLMLMVRLNIHLLKALQLLVEDFPMCVAPGVSRSVLKVRRPRQIQLSILRSSDRDDDVVEAPSASHGPVHAPPDGLRGSPDSNAQLQGDGNAELLNVMKQLLSDQKKRYDGSESSWTSARGRAPGMRWRGGTDSSDASHMAVPTE